MRKAKVVAGAAKKTDAKRSRKPSLNSAAAGKPRARAIPKPETKESTIAEGPAEPSMSEVQARVVAAKFTGAMAAKKAVGAVGKRAARPSLPTSYGESHLLLLVRDPETLFAAWDVAPAVVDRLKARLGARAYAVSTLTLRVTRAGGTTKEFHLGKRVRTRYLKIDGGPSFIAEIGFTTPAGRFELAARSAPCFVPSGPNARPELLGTGPRAVLGYREALALARLGLSPSAAGDSVGPRAIPAPAGSRASSADPSGIRILGGASDLYRR
jgi:hypothetical protein